ncbi:hypothetical protein CEUSTIGMA_g12127.t1 [Chlamydomonas eustigma]|uniref:Magnesium transporter n=1 Tax=Chlamydomonas eustigma TaxID=1157962 RepID=A0A250XNN5_9CHLO|nr:hypothetical protein CEUSTIGMA_g12127.t1 [Chlamydomonas eustigma]|eukprot:GAX84705.1 hypothetical protein CEUSTIGMA_g12127.t1 [Chlamydomonas eustigma]
MTALGMALMVGAGTHPRVSIRDEDDDHTKLVEMQPPDFNVISQDADDMNAQLKRRQGTKKRGASKATPQVVRTWLRIEPNGEGNVLQADKYKLTTKLGIQTRDLRLLDPHFSATYPSCILCRDKSVVVNLEHIKAIITTKFMLVVNPEEDATIKFISSLKERLASPSNSLGKVLPSMGDLQRTGQQAIPRLDVDLPFELRALEICLDELASEFDLATSELEASAYPSLDSLANKVTSPKLEKVRRIKNRLVRLTTRVETVREVLEKFLNDDEDMHDLNLTANEAKQTAQEEPDLATVSKVSERSIASTNSSLVESEVAEVEMLLETYFMHYDNTYNRLKTLNEYIKDTEDLVNIKLDQHRNQLITTDLILTALTCGMAIITTISGIFGMNLDSGLQVSPNVFNEVTIATCLGALILFVAFIIFAWRRGLLSWS